MDFDLIRAELEQDLAWRVDEIRFFKIRGAPWGKMINDDIGGRLS